MNPERSIPSTVLKGAKGLAILTVAKAGMLVAYKLGSGLVVARRSDGSWSAPSAIVSVGLGWGAQVSLASVKTIDYSVSIWFLLMLIFVSFFLCECEQCLFCFLYKNKRKTVKERKCIDKKRAI